MATKKAPPVFDPRVARGYALRDQIETLALELAELEAELVRQAPATFCDEQDRTCTAVGPIPAGMGPETYALREGEDDKARLLAGEGFAELFERKVTFTPRPGFADRADVLLTPAKKRDLLALCMVPGKVKPARAGYVLWE